MKAAAAAWIGVHMKKKIRLMALVMLFFACLAYSPQAAYAEPETALPEESMEETADNRLSLLEIAQALLNPEFNPEQLTYTAVVPNEVTRVALLAETMSPQAKKIINGTSDLQVGENAVVVIVTAADGSVREYRITVTREAASGEEPGADPGVPDPAESAPVESDPVDPNPVEPLPEEPDPAVTEPEGTTDGQMFPAETDSSQEPGFVVDDGTGSAASASDAQNTFLPGGKTLSGRNLLLLILAGFCLVLVCVIVALLVVRRRSDEDEFDDEPYDDEPYDDEDDPLDDFAQEDAQEDSAGETKGKTKDETEREDAADLVTPEELARFYQALNITEENTPETGEAEKTAGLEDLIDLDALEDTADLAGLVDLEDAADLTDLVDLDEVANLTGLADSENAVDLTDLDDLDDWDDWEDSQDGRPEGTVVDLQDSEPAKDADGFEEIEILDLEEEDGFLEEDDDFDFLDV